MMKGGRTKHIFNVLSLSLIFVFVGRNCRSLKTFLISPIGIESIPCEIKETSLCCMSRELHPFDRWPPHADWVLSFENETSACFSPTKKEKHGEEVLRGSNNSARNNNSNSNSNNEYIIGESGLKEEMKSLRRYLGELSLSQKKGTDNLIADFQKLQENIVNLNKEITTLKLELNKSSELKPQFSTNRAGVLKGVQDDPNHHDMSITAFPQNKISPHINHLVDAFDGKGPQNGVKFDLTVPFPDSLPSIYTADSNRMISRVWKTVLDRVFREEKQNRTIPGNVTFGVSLEDGTILRRKGYFCFVSSSAKGEFAVPNFLEIERMAKKKEFNSSVLWEERKTTPVWRGSGWAIGPSCGEIKNRNQTTIKEILRHCDVTGRLRLVHFSNNNPNLVDAALSGVNWGDKTNLWKFNSTNELHKLLPYKKIPQDEYYEQYQVALVLRGYGAAFRTPIHLSTGTAVVLQDSPYEEWYIQYMDPFVHYIPLKNDLSNLNETLHWIRENPEKVREIASNGKAFYDAYLSFEQIEEFIYELVYKLALKNQMEASKLV